MSRGTVVAKRYAKALFELAREQNVVAEVETQLSLLTRAIEQDADYRAFLAAPAIPAASKIEAVKASFAGQMLPIVLNTVGLLVERGRHNDLSGVLSAYLTIAGDALGRVDAYVKSAQPMTLGDKDKLANKFGALLSKTVRVHNETDASLLGGLTVRIGDTLYDGSLRSKLERLDKALQSSAN
ncbi:ATP synthase F1 subunit delta [Cohnella lubricantis]|uniref:ATP synthase subunit delta n=1 Tax=Cohnella lubricantis TaxID=2163172 RepID=A0A841T5F4_9BACL|nr:ATP synthase F1 subunit delta [Cohnella lubricantis]MBB6676763.1 ATP synthase F1 subunit delta [Cohnella lubricantis]MBP2117809.1 F-type H+-transporting ATPase subunit delta [Cohnella lubricantis]